MEAAMTRALASTLLLEENPCYGASSGTDRFLEASETKHDPQHASALETKKWCFDAVIGSHSRISWASPDILPDGAESEPIKAGRQIISRSLNSPPEFVGNEQIYDAIESLYLSSNSPRDQQIAHRITALYRDALAEDERIRTTSLHQFKEFFLSHPDLGLPKITLTPDRTLRVRWIQGEGSFTAIEFTGTPLAHLVADIPREGGLTAQYFCFEPVATIRSFARGIGASFV
jgi:hypothetical protein